MRTSNTVTVPAGLAGETRTVSAWLWAALIVALVGLAGSLFLSLGMNLKACALCFYQRAFMMSLVAVLGMGLAVGMGQAGRLSLLALPLTIAGLGVAVFHVYLEASGKLECPRGVLGLGSAPQQSLGVFVVLLILLLGDGLRGSLPALAGGIVLGAVLAVGSCIANPPPVPRTSPWPDPIPDICRTPYRSP